MAELIFLKLGGSLITDKTTPRAFRRDDCVRLGREIREALGSADIRLLIGHGAGSFAHVPARRYNTRAGLPGGGGWRGCAETRRAVTELNSRVLNAFAEADFHPLAAPPSALGRAADGALVDFDLRPVRTFLDANQVPMVFGDVVLDDRHGFTICSTESILEFIAARLCPRRVLLACDVDGVFPEDPARQPGAEPIAVLDAASDTSATLTGARGADVTGGMASKVAALRRMAALEGVAETRIVSGRREGVVKASLAGTYDGGTIVR